MRVLIQLMVLVYHLPLLVKSTSFKMDFLSSGTVRTDPLTFSQIGNCLSDHVHRFYGAVSPRTMRPDVSYQDLRSASGNTGNVEENKSLYWNPAIYQGSIHVLIRHLWSLNRWLEDDLSMTWVRLEYDLSMTERLKLSKFSKSSCRNRTMILKFCFDFHTTCLNYHFSCWKIVIY